MKIVVGYLDSPEGEAALEAAVAESQARGGSLVIVHSRLQRFYIVENASRFSSALAGPIRSQSVPHSFATALPDTASCRSTFSTRYTLGFSFS